MSKFHSVDRRQFLVGAGGFLLAVPTLGSLRPRAARAQAMTQKRFVFICSDHGGVYPENFYPRMPEGASRATLLPAVGGVPEHTIRWTNLTATPDGSRARISNTLEAPAGVLTDRIVGKMNVVAGLDVTTYLAHHRGGLGNFGAADEGINVPMMATVDQLMAASPSFALTAPKERSLHFALDYGVGSGLRSTMSAQRVGNSLTPVQAETSPGVLWERLFQDATPSEPSPSAPLVVDRVLEHYQAVRNGTFGDAARLSSADRERLDSHMERLYELQRKLSVTVDCGQPPRPDYGGARERLAQAVDLLSIALSCGASNIAVISLSARPFSPDTGWTNWHEQVAHIGGGSRPGGDFQPINYRAQREVFEHAFLAMANRLDVDAGNGETVLDNTLLVWSMESGEFTHDNVNTPIVTAGSAGGWFHTGRFVDLRNVLNTRLGGGNRWPGTVYNRFLSNVLQSMGVTPEEWHAEFRRVQPEAYDRGIRGYGAFQYDPNNFYMRDVQVERDLWPEMHYQSADDPIPGLAVGA